MNLIADNKLNELFFRPFPFNQRIGFVFDMSDLCVWKEFHERNFAVVIF